MTVALEPLTMQAAAEFWKNKVKLGPAEFAALSDEAKIMAFGVSGIAKGAELETVFSALTAAIETGISFGEFKLQCADIFARRGWTGKREWRVQNIFRTNIQTAYNAGRWKEQTANSDVFPFLQYNAVNDRRTRPTHKALDGKVFPIDHRFWNTWYPPNGYRCRCSTISLTERQLQRQGLKVETEDPTDTPVEIENPVTGAKMTVQQLLPDPGFDHNPGKVVWGGMAKREEKPSFSQLEGLAGPAEYGRKPLTQLKPSTARVVEELLPSGQETSAYREEFVRRYGEESVVRDAINEPVIFSSSGVDPGAHGETIPLWKAMLEQPYEIWLTPMKDQESGLVRLVKNYVLPWRTRSDGQAAGVAVGEVVDAVFRGVTVMASLDGNATDLAAVEQRRRGLLLYPRR